tara:strand:- start:2689 stop:3369 length:681 start_codon:yes stop_codon:yes gene_type:complete
MKKELLKKIVRKKINKYEFALITNIYNGENCVYEKNRSLAKSFKKYEKKINSYFNSNKTGIIENTNIFIETYKSPIKVIIIGAVHISQYLINFIKYLNFDIFLIDPRKHFASKERFPEIDIINEWPDKALTKIDAGINTALITLSHDPKIDDPALKQAIRRKFFYIGALGSKNTHLKRCSRLKKSGFSNKEISKIFGPIGIKLGGKSSAEIALSITAQLISEINKK